MFAASPPLVRNFDGHMRETDRRGESGLRLSEPLPDRDERKCEANHRDESGLNDELGFGIFESVVSQSREQSLWEGHLKRALKETVTIQR